MQLELSCGALRATVETLGGELVSFRGGDGVERIWWGDPAYWDGRNPILFPAVGAIKNDRVRFGGVEHTMHLHGFAQSEQFVPVEQGQDWVTVELRENPGTLAQYPYPFRLRVRYALMDKGFTTAYTVKNEGDRPMPYCIGGHTAYRCPVGEDEAFEDYCLVFDQVEDTGSIVRLDGGVLSHRELEEPSLHGTDTIPLRYEIFDRVDTLIFDGLRSDGVSLVNKKTGRGVHVSFPDFPMLGVWTMPHKRAPYICIEPWHGCGAFEDESGDFEDKPYCITLSPGQEKTLGFATEFI